MITAISGISFNNRKQRIRSKDNISFGSIVKRAKILKAYSSLIKASEKTNDHNKITEMCYDFFYEKIKGIIAPSLNLNPKKTKFLGLMKHELLGKIQNRMIWIANPKSADELEIKHFSKPKILSDTDFVGFQRNEIKQSKKDVEICLNRLKVVERWANKPNLVIPFETFQGVLISDLETIPKNKVKVIGLELLNGKKVKNPAQLYDLFSQPLHNADKYSENKPFKVIIKKYATKKGDKYYAFFINPKTKPIPNEEIDKLQEVGNYRTLDAINSGIFGTGFGNVQVKTILSENNCEKEIKYLFQKNKKTGVCVRVPLIGIQNN